MKRARLLLAAAGVLAVGCRNPLDPKADIRIENITGLNRILQSNAATLGNDPQFTTVQFASYGTVGCAFNGYTVVYRQVGPQNDPACSQGPGQPICALGGAAGRRYSVRFHMGPKNDDLTLSVVNSYSFAILTPEVMKYISAHTDTTNGGIDCDLTFFGTDHNDHDITVTGTFHVEVFN